MIDPTLARQHRRAILLLSCAAFASASAARMCDPMLPDLARDFSASAIETAHVVSGFSVTYGLLQVFFGPLADRVGKYRLIALITLISTLGAFACAFAGSLDALVLARVLTGATSAGIIPLAMAWIGDTIAYEERQATLARFLSGQIFGVIGGQFAGGFFADTLGWRWAFGALGVAYLCVGALVLLESMRNPSTAHHHPEGRALGVFRQAAHVLAVPWARVILAIVFVEGMAVFGVLAFVPSYLHERFGLSLTSAGAMMGLFGIGGFTYTLFAQRFVKRFGEVGLALGGGLVMCASWTILTLAPVWEWALLTAYLVGFGYYLLHNTLQTNATQMAPEYRGTAVSLFASAFFLGQSCGVVVAAQVIAWSGANRLFAATALLIPLIGGGFAWLVRRRLASAQ